MEHIETYKNISVYCKCSDFMSHSYTFAFVITCKFLKHLYNPSSDIVSEAAIFIQITLIHQFIMISNTLQLIEWLLYTIQNQ